MSHTSRRPVHRIAIAAAALLGAAMSSICTTTAHADTTAVAPEHRGNDASGHFEVIVEEQHTSEDEFSLAQRRYPGAADASGAPFLEESASQAAQRMTTVKPPGLVRGSVSDRQDGAGLNAETSQPPDQVRGSDTKKDAHYRVETAEDALHTEHVETTQADSTSGGEQPAIPDGAHAASATALRFAYDQIGKPYKWGAAGPDSYDCSGLTSAAWAEAGVDLPHNAAKQSQTVAEVSRDELQPGDLVFYYEGVSHVALFAGEDKVVHAPTSGQSVTTAGIEDMPVQGYGRPE